MRRKYMKHSFETDGIIIHGMENRNGNSQKAAAKKVRQEIFRATGKKYSEASIINRYYRLEKDFKQRVDAKLKSEKSKYAKMCDSYESKRAKASMDFITSLVKECREISIENISDEKGILVLFK